MTPAPVSMKCLTASPDRGAILPSTRLACQLLSPQPGTFARALSKCSMGGQYTQQPWQTAICNPVLTSPLPLADIVVGSEAYRS